MAVDTGGHNLCSMDKFNSTLVKILPDFIGLLIFATVSFLTFTIFIYTDSSFLRLFFISTLMTITMIRAIMFISQIIFSPSIIQFRILPMHCGTAITLHRLLVWTSAYMISTIMFSIVAYKLGAHLQAMQMLHFIFVTLLLLVTAIAIVVYRKKIKSQMLLVTEAEPTWGRQKFAEVWHLLALVYVVILWFLIVYLDNTDNQQISRSAFFISFFIVPIWLVMNRLVQWIVELSLRTLKIYDNEPPANLTVEELEQNEQGRIVYSRCKTIARLVLFFVLAVWLTSLWGLSLPFVSKFTEVIFDAAIILTIAIIFWQFISSWIERKIEESIPDDEGEKEEGDEWGAGASRGRSYTLLPMIRKFIGSILVVMVTMTVLSSMGVDIGPLLAGAGVVGLAVGFGAQKLVADMFSGFFYLLDDAFRVGEYLEAGTVSGRVENITLRNVMLRHHRGMLQIVPHSELGPITNFMRGGIVVKFNLDFPYDADIDQIRKVIKKVGQAMLKDEEIGKDFIQPVKSQGVREISNSVMTIRVKFTAQPGTHFVIRREAFKRITEALSKKGIHYAHKKVIVDLPQETTENITPKQAEVAGAAAMQAIEQDEKDELTEGKKGSEMMGG